MTPMATPMEAQRRTGMTGFDKSGWHVRFLASVDLESLFGCLFFFVVGVVFLMSMIVDVFIVVSIRESDTL